MKTILALLLMISNPAFGSIEVQPPHINFASIKVGSFGSSQLFTIRNAGPEIILLNVEHTCYGDIVVNPNCPTELGPNLDCSVEVRFTPRQAGYQSCTITPRDHLQGQANVTVSAEGID